MSEHVVLILSGGLDSTVLGYRLRGDGTRLTMLSFDYGQRHRRELEYARRTAVKLTGVHRVVDLSAISGLLAGSSLTDAAVEVPDGHYGFNVSPKLASFAAAGDARRRINPEALRALVATGRAVFKFVASRVADLEEIADLQREFDLRPVWVMPEGTTTERLLEVMRALADEVVARGWHLSTRLHVMLWGDARGR